ncbi:MAG: TolC family protein [Desulfobacterales bacterium]|nr:TolC family protein [Desulfobacterales bacterium]
MKSFVLKFALLMPGLFLMNIFLSGTTLAKTNIWAPPELARIIEQGLKTNKEIKSLESQVEMLKEKTSVAGSLSDPRIGIGILNLPLNSLRFNEQPMTQKQVFIAQKVPWFGKRDLKSFRASLTADKRKVKLDAKKLEISRKIASLYYEMGYISFSREINLRLKDIMNKILKIAEVRYTTGKGLQQDIFQTEVELSKLQDEKFGLDKKLRIKEDMINELLNPESRIRLTPPSGMKYQNLSLNINELTTLAIERNPFLKIKGLEAEYAKVDISLAKKSFLPDMDFKVAYGRREEDIAGRDWADFISASVTMNIPLWKKSRQDKNLSAGHAGSQAAIKSYKNILESLPYKIDVLVAEINHFQKSYKLYSDKLVLQANDWAWSSMASYEVGRVGFDTMIKAQIRLIRFEQKAEKYLFNIYMKRAELEELLGGPISEIN